MCEYGESFIPLSMRCGQLLDLVQKRKHLFVSYAIMGFKMSMICTSI